MTQRSGTAPVFFNVVRRRSFWASVLFTLRNGGVRRAWKFAGQAVDQQRRAEAVWKSLTPEQRRILKLEWAKVHGDAWLCERCGREAADHGASGPCGVSP